jgi:D-sedoheptulose 7-phosphate isomerase
LETTNMLVATIKYELQNHIQALEETVIHSESLIVDIVECISQCFERGNKLLLCGNGGSADDAQHVAAEFINRFRVDRRPLPAIALTTNTSTLTAIGNDSSFEQLFSRQVEALAVPGDIVVGISTSGRSMNVLKALDVAQARRITTIGFTGSGGKETMKPKCDYCLIALSTDTARIQECHEFIWHLICGMVENKLFPQAS